MDIKRNAKLDLSLPKVRNSYLDRIRAKEFDTILLSPPCATVERDRAILGNIFADFSFEIATLVAEGAATFLAMEQPETLERYPLAHTGGPARLDVAVAAASRPVEKGAKDCGFPPS